MDGITPILLKNVKSDFLGLLETDKKFIRIARAIQNGNLSWEMASKYSVRVGELLSLSLVDNITAETLPNGHFYRNIADEILRSTLSIDYDMVSGVAGQVQKYMNQKSGIGIKALIPNMNESRTKGLIDKVSSEEHFEDVSWVLKEPIVNYSQSIVDETIQENAKFHAKAGLRVTVERTAEKGACEWCVALASQSPYRVIRGGELPHELFQRHERCRCNVSYNSVKLSPYLSPNKMAKNTFR